MLVPFYIRRTEACNSLTLCSSNIYKVLQHYAPSSISDMHNDMYFVALEKKIFFFNDIPDTEVTPTTNTAVYISLPLSSSFSQICYDVEKHLTSWERWCFQSANPNRGDSQGERFTLGILTFLFCLFYSPTNCCGKESTAVFGTWKACWFSLKVPWEFYFRTFNFYWSFSWWLPLLPLSQQFHVSPLIFKFHNHSFISLKMWTPSAKEAAQESTINFNKTPKKEESYKDFRLC